MKKFLLTFFGVCLSLLMYAQCNTFFPLVENKRYEYDHLDKKEKLSLRTTQTIKNVTGSSSSMKATMVHETIDAKKGTVMSTAETEWECNNGTLHFAMNSLAMAADNGQQANVATGVTVDISGDKMDLPSDLKVGQSLKDITYNMKMAMSGMTLMDRDFTVTDRKVEAEEKVTTPAGTFDCIRMSFKTTSTKGIGSGTTISKLWYAKDVGLVKSENYKEDGKLLGKQLLTKVSN